MSDERFSGGAPMVRWFEPRQLLQTAAKVIASAARTDYRALEALGEWQDPFAYDNRDELWIDYVADTGDGFNPTYAVAATMARDPLELEGAGEPLAAGDLVVIGGDLVYPVAERKLYKERLELPFEAAYPKGDPERDLFALPGNHDWYDGLVSFNRKFCYPGRTMGSLQIRQSRSYFALKLPGNWWLLALDIQLGCDIDQPQLDYFRKAAWSDFGAGDRVIICTAVPGWLEADGETAKNFGFIEREIHETGARIHLWLAGDLHCYMRHTAEIDGITAQKITAGGGGAFMHPTHGRGIERTRPACRYPEPARSRSASWGNLLFFVRNPGLALLLGALYALIGVAAAPAVGEIDLGFGRAGDALLSGLGALAGSPFALLLALVVLLGAVQFAGGKRSFGLVGGGLLGLAIIATAIAAAWLAGHTAAALPPGIGRLYGLEVAVHLYVIGGIFGLIVFGVFLTAANLAGEVLSHGFSALRIQDYKNFVRLRVRADGAVDLFAVGIDRVPRAWRRRGGAIVADGAAIEPHLIEHVRLAEPRE